MEKKTSPFIRSTDVTQAFISSVKTDASFGYGKPRYICSDLSVRGSSRDFNPMKLIKETITDLSYSHHVLRKRKESHEKNLARRKLMREELEEQVEIMEKLESNKNSPTDNSNVPSNETLDALCAETPEAARKTPVVLPALYKHQGNKVLKRDYTKRVSKEPLDITEAVCYRYVRQYDSDGNQCSTQT